MMTSTQTTSTRGSAARRMAVLLATGLMTAGSAEAARVLNWVGPIPYPTAPSAAINDVRVNVTTNGTGTANDWLSTRFTWTDSASSTFSACSSDPTPDVTSSVTRLTQLIDTVAPGTLANPWISVRTEAFQQNSCGGTGSTPIFSGSDSFTFNPDLAAACGQKIILILDESYSIAVTGGNHTNEVKAGAKALLTAIADTGSAVSVIEFGTDARLAQIGAFIPGQYVDVTSIPSGGTLTDFFAYLDDQTGSSTDPDGYCPGCLPAQYTNWQDALLDASGVINNNGPADMVVFLTDGNPTTDNVPGNGCDLTNPPPAQCLPPALAAANTLKGLGAHTLVVAVGGDINIDNIQLISGPDEITAATTDQVKVGDFTQLPFDQLETAFRQLAFVLCAPSVTVNKLVDPDGSGPADPVRTALFPFEAKVINIQNADRTAYQWVSPRAASDCATPTPEAGLGCPGPGTAGAPDNVGQVQLGWTGSNGSLNFGWVPGTVANPLAEASTMLLREDATGFDFQNLVCRRERLDLANPDNPPTQTLFACTETGTGTVCSGDPGECSTLVVCRNGLDVSNVDDGVVISVGSGDIVTCEVLNYNTLDFGDAPDTYGTRLASNGASHVIGGVYLNVPPDAEPDGQPTSGATGDDTNGTDDEGGLYVAAPGVFTAGQTVGFFLGNPVGGEPGIVGTGVVSVWIDWNQDGDFLDTGEGVVINQPVSNANPEFTAAVPATATPGRTFVRVRVTAGTAGSTNSGSPTGPAGVGEVEDSTVLVENNLDFGDALDTYGTTLAADGARHRFSSDLYLGAVPPDVEADAWAPLDGTGDDVNPTTPDDEDGVTFQTFAGAGFPIQANVTGYVGDIQAMLCGYMDGAADGVLDGIFTQNITNYGSLGFGVGTATAGAGNEAICILVPGAGGIGLFNSLDIPAVPGFNGASATCQTNLTNKTFQCALTFNPNFTAPVTTYARFRLTRDRAFFTNNSPSPTGPADSGEVEDYRILVNPTVVTIGSVDLTVATVADFLGGLGVDGMDTQALLELLAAWDPEAAAALAGADREAILAALRRYLDPDGDGQVAVLSWDTLEQRGTVGFYVDRREAGGASSVRINGDMLPALIGAPLGGEYLLADPTARAGVSYEYTLIEQEAQGTTRSYGPFRLEVSP